MPPSVLSAFLVFTFITAFTPGPNNILALGAGASRGFLGSMPVVAGISFGFLCVMAASGALVFSFSTLSARFTEGMKYVGCVYICLLAWKIAAEKPKKEISKHAGEGFLTGFMLQFVNVKIMVYGITSYSGFILPYHSSVQALLAGIGVLTLIGILGVVAWAFAGSLLQSFFHRYAKAANGIMAILLLGCAASLLV